ncbi:CinA family protein [Mycetocola sp. JXN-3]|uniref:CinA family protein n=1 Tax=Mycetocola sp. JXN-3 TaxID=2116510 RepID=UPI00165D1514|nr:CinA family protein [Mycetocola sp. JXN-3]
MTGHPASPAEPTDARAAESGDARSREAELADVVACGYSIAVAESLTGGLVLASIVSVPGASAVLRGGVVAYDTELKHRVLGVDAVLLAEFGPVDPRVAEQMARGARRIGTTAAGEAQIGVSTTGVAGPTPDPQTGTPVGTVFIGISSVRGDRSIAVHARGDRAQIREWSVREAIRAVLEEARILGEHAHS